MNLKIKDKVILTCNEEDFENQEPRRDCINKIVTIKKIFYDKNNNIDTFFVEENKYEWVAENILTRVSNNMTLQEKIDLVKHRELAITNKFSIMKTEVKYILELIRDKTISIDNGTDRILNLFSVSVNEVDHSITSQDFKMWLQSIDDDETELEDLHQEYLTEVKANKH